MSLKYITKIVSNVSIYSKLRTGNILDGTYKSIHKGKSMNFDTLREYTFDDDVKDIDWKASARSCDILVKQYVSEKKHNIMLVLDSGIKMNGMTVDNSLKNETTLYVAGTIGYLAIKNGDYVGTIYNTDNKTKFSNFNYNLYKLEQTLTEYEVDSVKENKRNLQNILEYIYKNIKKKMIIFIVTDIDGLDNLDINLLKKINNYSDVFVININDSYIASGENIYDLDNNSCISEFFSLDKKLLEEEKEVRNKLYRKIKYQLRKNSISNTFIDGNTDLTKKIIELLEEHKYATTK